MAVIINASTSTGLVQSADTSGIIQFQSNGSTKATLNSSGFSYPGGVLQVISTFDNTQYAFNTGSPSQSTYYSISGLTATITPSSSSNKILLIATCAVGQTGNSYNNFLRFYRGGTAIALGNPSGFLAAATGGFRSVDSSALGSIAMNFLDSPETTSATTYSIQICNSGGSSALSTINRPATYNGWEHTGSSTLTLLEVAA